MQKGEKPGTTPRYNYNPRSCLHEGVDCLESFRSLVVSFAHKITFSVELSSTKLLILFFGEKGDSSSGIGMLRVWFDGNIFFLSGSLWEKKVRMMLLLVVCFVVT